MVISVASGKGGTGKTTVAVNLALSLEDALFLDCDVEEPNAHIFLKPGITAEEKAFVSVPEVDEAKCTLCGRCQEVCAYNAIAVLQGRGNGDGKGRVLVFPHLCHGCGACTLFCPRHAIKEVGREIGVIETGSARGVGFVSGRLNVGEARSPSLIRQVKDRIAPGRTVIIDAPPGTSCPMIAAVKGSDFCILVTEPTPFGLNDLTLAVEVVRKLEIPFGVLVNRSGAGDAGVDSYCRGEKIPVLMKIPFRRDIASAYSNGISIVEFRPEYRESFRELSGRIEDCLRGGKAQ